MKFFERPQTNYIPFESYYSSDEKRDQVLGNIYSLLKSYDLTNHLFDIQAGVRSFGEIVKYLKKDSRVLFDHYAETSIEDLLDRGDLDESEEKISHFNAVTGLSFISEHLNMKDQSEIATSLINKYGIIKVQPFEISQY